MALFGSAPVRCVSATPLQSEEPRLPETRARVGDSEKMTVNLGVVDLGQVDLLVQEGFYSNRSDFVRTAVRNLLAMAQEQGWVHAIGRGGHEVLISPGFAQRCIEWMSLELAWMNGMAHAACSALEIGPLPG
eukprot:gene40018-52841_t